MKKSLVALAVLGTLAGTASAQSSVTAFGVVDLAMRYTKANGQSLSKLDADGLSSSRLGFRGIEDLGGGLKAGFWLEGALNADVGTAGDAPTTTANRFWGRRATVSLSSNELGEIRLGRAKTSLRTLIDDFDVYGTVGMGAVTQVYSTLGSGADTINRSDNQVSYILPSIAGFGGFYGSVDAAPGEGTLGKKYAGGRIGYKEGAWHVSGAYQETATAGSRWKLGSVAGTYDFGIVKAGVLFSQSKYFSRKQNIWTVNAVVPVGPGTVQLSYTKADANGAASAASVAAASRVYDAQLYSASYVYNLSKRTALYTTISLVDNDGQGKFGVASTPAVAAGGQSGGFDVGIRHSF
ncbi:MAG: porin [Burkholderiaceae bacterium]